MSVKSYDTFVFDSYGYDSASGRISLRYSLDGSTELATGDAVRFEEAILLPKHPSVAPAKAASETLQAALFALHLIGGVSYYKTCCPKKLDVRSGTLDEAQASFWNTVYTKGLGEFFYKNQIDFRGLVKFPAQQAVTTKHQAANCQLPTRYLVPIGGGKDSLVTIERLKSEGKDITLLRMGKHPLIDALVQETKLPCLTVERHLPKELFALNAQGALNGHVPITTYLSFLAVVLAELYDFDAVVLSSEKSADEGNVRYLDEEINHQWSKSAEAETLIRSYIRDFISPNLAYENPLRELTELHIAEEFCRYPQYFDLFTSCNANWKIAGTVQETGSDRWCGKCPKCAFVFALFSAYLPKKTLVSIFSKNLYADASLEPLYRELLGLEAVKPFECVGTPQETREAMQLARTRGEYDQDAVMRLLSTL